MKALYIPFLLQGIAMIVDEFYFHEQRGLSSWERYGHPLDSLSVIACYSYLIWGKGEMNVYLFLCSLSCLFITKDEFIHATKCKAAENWLHSLLFILHPLSFVMAYLLWMNNEEFTIKFQLAIVLIFTFYQILRWSIYGQSSPSK